MDRSDDLGDFCGVKKLPLTVKHPLEGCFRALKKAWSRVAEDITAIVGQKNVRDGHEQVCVTLQPVPAPIVKVGDEGFVLRECSPGLSIVDKMQISGSVHMGVG